MYEKYKYTCSSDGLSYIKGQRVTHGWQKHRPGQSGETIYTGHNWTD